MKGKNVYILESFTPYVHDDVKFFYEPSTKDGSIELTSEHVGVFDSVENAEKVIKELIRFRKEMNDKYDDWITYCAFLLTEHKVNGCLDDFGNPPGTESVRSYLGNGELNCFSDYDDRCNKRFNGRKDQSKFVKAGDYAFYLRRDKLIPILVEKLAPSKEEWKQMMNPGVFGDITDDSGLAFMVDYGHDHPFSPYVFPMSILPGHDISESVMTKLQIEKLRYEKGEL